MKNRTKWYLTFAKIIRFSKILKQFNISHWYAALLFQYG